MEWDSKVDFFDKRLELWRAMARRERGTRVAQEEVAHLSLFEFYWKYHVKGTRIRRCERDVALMYMQRLLLLESKYRMRLLQPPTHPIFTVDSTFKLHLSLIDGILSFA